MSRELRVIVEIVDENGNRVYPEKARFVSTPLRDDATFKLEADFYKVLLYLGECISVTMRKDPTMSPLYPKTPYKHPISKDLGNGRKLHQIIYGEWCEGIFDNKKRKCWLQKDWDRHVLELKKRTYESD